jgi:hypothetical protein
MIPNELLNQVLGKMPNYFSSNEFANLAVKKGLPKKRVSFGDVSAFLHHNAIQSKESNRMWHKKQDTKKANEIEIPFCKESKNEENAISFLKSKGYRISKKVEEWVEI